MSYTDLQNAVDDLRASNEALVDQVLASDTATQAALTGANTALAGAEAARDEALSARDQTLAYRNEMALQAGAIANDRMAAEAAQAEAESHVSSAAAEANRAEAAKNSAALVALGDSNARLLSIAKAYSKPSLSLDFLRRDFWKQGKYPWSEEPAALTFSRSTSKWVFGPDGVLTEVAPDEMAYEYDPLTGEPLGLSIEASSTNLLPNSSDLSQWTAYAVNVTPSSDRTPMEGGTAYYISDSNDDSRMHSIGVRDTAYASEGEEFTASVYVKAAESTQVYIAVGRPNEHRAFMAYDLAEGATIGDGDTNGPYEFVGRSARYVGSGWYHLTVTCVMREGEQSVGVGMGVHTSKTFSTKGVPGSGLLVFAPQLEAGTSATSYIPTSGSSTTRTPDSLKYFLGDEYIQETGSLVADFSAISYDQQFNRVFQMGNTKGGAYAALSLEIYNNSVLAYFRAEGAMPTRFHSAGEYEEGSSHKAALTFEYGTGQIKATVDAGSISTRTVTSPEIVDVLGIGGSHTGSQGLNGHIKSLAYYPRVLTDAELQEVTS